MITITSALYTSKDTIPQETTSTAYLWEKKDTKNLKMWFLEEPNEVENKAPTTELILKGEIIRMNIDSIFIVLEAGIGHRTVPMLLAKSRFSGEGKNWSSLINLYCQLELEVSICNFFPDSITNNATCGVFLKSYVDILIKLILNMMLAHSSFGRKCTNLCPWYGFYVYIILL